MPRKGGYESEVSEQPVTSIHAIRSERERAEEAHIEKWLRMSEWQCSQYVEAPAILKIRPANIAAIEVCVYSGCFLVEPALERDEICEQCRAQRELEYERILYLGDREDSPVPTQEGPFGGRIEQRFQSHAS